MHIVRRPTHHVCVQISRAMEFVDCLSAELETDAERRCFLDAIRLDLESRKQALAPPNPGA